jgi:HTH-type transcriptional regulator, cell division transcriptional repressor
MKKTANVAARNIIGPQLRRIRLRKSPAVSLEDLAGRLAARGVQLDRSAVGRIENGKRYVLDYELKALASALHVPLTEFFR